MILEHDVTGRKKDAAQHGVQAAKQLAILYLRLCRFPL
jgi:hypothetical protein